MLCKCASWSCSYYLQHSIQRVVSQKNLNRHHESAVGSLNFQNKIQKLSKFGSDNKLSLWFLFNFLLHGKFLNSPRQLFWANWFFFHLTPCKSIFIQTVFKTSDKSVNKEAHIVNKNEHNPDSRHSGSRYSGTLVTDILSDILLSW